MRRTIQAGLVALAMWGCSDVPRGDEEEAVGLSEAEIAGENLSGTNLAGLNLGASNLAGANLAATNLAAANLAGANLGGTNLAGANSAGANSASGNSAAANLAGTNLAGNNLAGSNLASASGNSAGANLAGANLAGTNLAGTNLAGSNLGAAFAGANVAAVESVGGPLTITEPNYPMAGWGTKVYGPYDSAGPISVSLTTRDASPPTYALVKKGAVPAENWSDYDARVFPNGIMLPNNSTSLTGAGQYYLLLQNFSPVDQPLQVKVTITTASGTPKTGAARSNTNLTTAWSVNSSAGVGNGFGSNIHGTSSAASRMLYSREDVFEGAHTAQKSCVVMGIGSVAFSRLVNANTGNMFAGLNPLPWGVPALDGSTLKAWEAVVWGNNSYCVFVVLSPQSTSHLAMAGFLKAIWRYNADASRSLLVGKINGGEAWLSYGGMMGAATKVLNGTIPYKNFLAGEMGFIVSTVNNVKVSVDFSSWVRDSSNNGLILGGTGGARPTYWEGIYRTVENADGTVSVRTTLADWEMFDMGGGEGVRMGNTSGIVELPSFLSVASGANYYNNWTGQIALNGKRCLGDRYMAEGLRNASLYPFGGDKCDDAVGLQAAYTAKWDGITKADYLNASATWSDAVRAGRAPQEETVNAYNNLMRVENFDGVADFQDVRMCFGYERASECAAAGGNYTRMRKPILAETYIFLYENPIEGR